MLITKKFTLIHMHKTGGQTLANIIIENFADHFFIGYHYPTALIPQNFSTLPVIGMVRNPWDWYVSWYYFNKNSQTRNPLFIILSDGGQADFSTTVTNLINLGDNSLSSEQYRKALISTLPDSIEGNKGVGLIKKDIENFSSNTMGYYSWLFTRMHGDLDSKNLHIGAFENLESSFISILEKLKVEENDICTIRSSFKSIGKINSSKREHYSQYYNDDLIQLIQMKEKVIIERYNYEYQIEDCSTKIDKERMTFIKLLGKEKNFLPIMTLNVDALISEVKKIPHAVWDASNRKEMFDIHINTQSVNFIFDTNFAHYNPTYLTNYYHFIHLLEPIERAISEHFNHSGFIGRMILVKLKAGKIIAPHTDNGYSLLHCHRMHLPLVTNENVIFNIGGEQKHLKASELCEINNATVHSVVNNSNEDRIHLIIDWIPNSTVRQEDKKNRIGVQTNNPLEQPCPCGSEKTYGNCHRNWQPF